MVGSRSSDVPAPNPATMQAVFGNSNYQRATTTPLDPAEVLGAFEQDPAFASEIAERTPELLIWGAGARHSQTYARAAIALCIGILLLVLGLMAVTPLFVMGIPLALLPALPFALGRRPRVALAAVREGSNDTQVTIHGAVPPAISQNLNAFLAWVDAQSVSEASG